jgi:hypothetical protein
MSDDQQPYEAPTAVEIQSQEPAATCAMVTPTGPTDETE